MENENKIVNQINQINFYGNITPHSWYQHPLLKRENGSTNHVAIMLLSDIIYWYRPVVVRDEHTGQIIEIRKKFAGDMLQKDYQSWGEYFGLTKRQVQDAVAFLKSKKLIKHELRTITTKSGNRLPNIVFIEPVVENIKKITFYAKEAEKPIIKQVPPPRKTKQKTEPPNQDDNTPNINNLMGDITLQSDISHDTTGDVSRLNGRGVTLERETITENTTEISSETSTENSLSLQSNPTEIENPKKLKQRERENSKNLSSKNGNGHSRFSQAICLEYVEFLKTQGEQIKSTRGLATTIYRDGSNDSFIQAWLDKKEKAQEIASKKQNPTLIFSDDPCPVCFGTRGLSTDRGFKPNSCQACLDDFGKPTGKELI